jgi:antitoxin CptB
MTDPQHDEAEIRKRRIVFRAWHRGTREMDLLLGRFTERFIDDMSDAEIAMLEQLMETPDPDIYNWLIGAAPVPAQYDTPLLRKIRAFHLGEGGAAS